jgi:hypothetical protein
MQEYMMKEGNKLNSPFLLYKIYIEDLSNVVEMCTNKCIDNYKNYELDSMEKLCLEKCYLKTLEMNKFVSDEMSNIINSISNEYTL